MRRLLALSLGTLLVAGFQSAPTPKRAPGKATVRPSPSPPPPPVLTGAVKGPDGKPVEGALIVVSVLGSAERIPLATKTDAQGVFKLPLKKSASVNVRVEKQGLAIRRFERWPPAKPLDVQLAKGGVIEGTVRDGPSGTLVAGARVDASSEAWDAPLPWDPEAGRVRASTDAKGHYRLEGLGAGTFVVSASVRDHGRASRQGAKVGSTVDLFLFPAPSISGTVLAPDGKPAPHAIVQAAATQGWQRSGVEVADGEGRFDLFGIRAGVYSVIARLPGLAPAIAPEVVVESEGETGQDLTLHAGGRVLGRLVSSHDRPIEGGRVRLQEAAGIALPREVQDLLQVAASVDGRFQLETVPPGPVVLVAWGAAGAPLRVEAEVRDGAATDLGDIVLDRGTAIEGHVRDSAGNGIGDARVMAFRIGGPTATRPEARTDADGAYVLAGVEAGTYNIMAQAPGFASARTKAEAGATDADLVLGNGGSITGLVVDDTGQSVQSFLVEVQPKGSSRWEEEGVGTTAQVVDDDGRFRVDDVGEGTFVVEVSANQYASAAVSDVRVRAGGTTDLGRIRLTGGGMVRGLVVTSDGAGIPGASVHARTSTNYDDGRNTTETDGQGAFELRGLPTGKVDLDVSHPAFADGSASGVEVDPAKPPVETRIVLRRGGRLEGTVRKRDGTPIVGGGVAVSSEQSWGSNLTPVRSDGSFAVDRVPAGHVNVVLMAGSGGRYQSQQSAEADVREGETTTVDFVSREILVSGRVTRGGAPAPGVRVDMMSAGGASYMGGGAGTGPAAPPSGPQRGTATTAEDGSYSLIVDSPGAYRVRLLSADGASSSGSRQVIVPDAEVFAYDLDMGGAPLTGSITDKADDTPIARAFVSARPKKQDVSGSRWARTGADGRFEIDLAAGDYTVTADADGYASARAEVSVGDSGGDVQFALLRGTPLEGRVLDPAGRGASNCPVTATAGTDPQNRYTDQADTLPDGSFRFKSLRNTPYALLAGTALSGFAFRAGVRPGGEAVTLTLQPAGQARIRVRGPDGTPVSGGWGSLRSVNGVIVEPWAVDSGQSDAGGVLLFSLPAGADEIEVRKDKLVGRATVNVTPGGSVSGEVTLRP